MSSCSLSAVKGWVLEEGPLTAPGHAVPWLGWHMSLLAQEPPCCQCHPTCNGDRNRNINTAVTEHLGPRESCFAMNLCFSQFLRLLGVGTACHVSRAR